MAKNMKASAAGVQVVLKCIYSGHDNSPGPGDVITVDADEAKRLIGIGAAKACDASDGGAGNSVDDREDSGVGENTDGDDDGVKDATE